MRNMHVVHCRDKLRKLSLHSHIQQSLHSLHLWHKRVYQRGLHWHHCSYLHRLHMRPEQVHERGLHWRHSSYLHHLHMRPEQLHERGLLRQHRPDLHELPNQFHIYWRHCSSEDQLRLQKGVLG